MRQPVGSHPTPGGVRKSSRRWSVLIDSSTVAVLNPPDAFVQARAFHAALTATTIDKCFHHVAAAALAVNILHLDFLGGR